ncbi:hypothetical protein JCM11641_006021, partial [Rhodosporidiobolus odoratus]
TQVDTFAISAPGIFTLSNIRALTSSSPDSLPANLPPTLVALQIHAPYFLPSDLIDMLKAAPQAKSLCAIGREPYQLHLGKRDRKERPTLPTHEEEQALEDVSRERGVRVVALSSGH